MHSKISPFFSPFFGPFSGRSLNLTSLSRPTRRLMFGLSAISSLLFAFQPALHAQTSSDPSNITVYYLSGKNRVHLGSCPRFTKIPAEQKTTMVTMTLAEAYAKNTPPCSRCPQVPGPAGAGSAASSATPSAPAPAAPTAAEDDQLVYWNGEKVIHFESCPRYQAMDKAERINLIPLKLSEARALGVGPCSSCPESPVKAPREHPKKSAPAPSAPTATTASGSDPIVYWAGKKRSHLEGCRRFDSLPEAEKAAMTRMKLSEALAKGVPLCSRCPKP